MAPVCPLLLAELTTDGVAVAPLLEADVLPSPSLSECPESLLPMLQLLAPVGVDSPPASRRRRSSRDPTNPESLDFRTTAGSDCSANFGD